jgi:[histone H3]-lysine36 N-dimethyltransferase SETMAR
MITKRDQRACIQFCFLLNKNAKETHQMLRQAFKEDAMGRTQVFEWFSRFKKGNMSLEDETRSGRPLIARNAANIEMVNQIIHSDRRLTIEAIAEETNISWSSIQEILTEDLNMKRIAAKWVPRLLNDDQKQKRLDVCRDLQNQIQSDPNFLKKVITGDETWIFAYDPETKQQSSQWKSPDSPRPKKCRQVRSKVKSMLICFFDYEGVVHKEFVPAGQTVNKDFYIAVLKRLRESIRKKRPEKWATQDWILHHDNAPAHTALSVLHYLAKNNMITLPHPAYSPDLAPCDFFLFPRLKKNLKGKRFVDVNEVEEKSQAALNSISKIEFKKCFDTWEHRLEKCINSQGNYFEGD